MKSSIWHTLPQAFLAATAVADSREIVHLKGYGSFSGTSINQTYSGHALPHAVDAWLGIDYATQPVGDRRFTQSTWPAAYISPAARNAGRGLSQFQCLQDAWRSFG
jgi:hypothetical protein